MDDMSMRSDSVEGWRWASGTIEDFQGVKSLHGKDDMMGLKSLLGIRNEDASIRAISKIRKLFLLHSRDILCRKSIC
jgi:hypothetical protein